MQGISQFTDGMSISLHLVICKATKHIVRVHFEDIIKDDAEIYNIVDSITLFS